MKNNKSVVKDFYIFIVILVLIVSRSLLPEDKCGWISGVNCIGVLIALFQLIMNTYNENKNSNNINFFIGLSVITGTITLILSVLVFINVIELEGKGNDILSLIALLLSLSNDFLVYVIEKFILGKKI